MSSIEIKSDKITIHDQRVWSGIALSGAIGFTLFAVSVTGIISGIFDLGLLNLGGMALCLFPMSIIALLGAIQPAIRYYRQGKRLIFFEATPGGFMTCANGDLRVRSDYDWDDLRGIILAEDYFAPTEDGALVINLKPDPALCLYFKSDIVRDDGFFDRQKRQLDESVNGLPIKVYYVSRQELDLLQSSLTRLSSGKVEIKWVEKLTALPSDPHHFKGI